MKAAWSLILLCVVSIVAATPIMSCGNVAAPPEGPKAPARVAAGPSLSPWDELVKAAQKEGTLTIYGTSIAPAMAPVREAFQERFGINVEFVNGRPNEIIAKITAERRAGLYLADVGHIGETSFDADVKPLGITVSLPGFLVLPEVREGKNWIKGELPFLDENKQNIMFMAQANPQTVINTDLVKAEDLVSFSDLLKPQWKGKIILSDPAISGGAPNMLSAIYTFHGREKTVQMFRQLATQELTITRDQRLLLEWVARGKMAIGLGYSNALFSDFRRAGAPVKMHSLKEPRNIFAGPGTFFMLDKNPHPKAAQLYVNWALSKEGSTVWSKALEFSSTRLDVGKDWIGPETVPQREDIFPDEEQLKLRVEMRKIGAEIFGHLLK